MACRGASQGQLSLCMIVRDEAELLPACLSSVQGLVDEIIVVDTGSTDDTVAIAQGLGAQVYHHVWQADFAQARNHSLSYAQGAWIVVLDADETLTPSFQEALGRLETSPHLAYECICISLHEMGQSAGPILRLFRNIAGTHYELPYHERLILMGQGTVGRDPALAILHTGYLRERFHQKDKLRRGVTIMTQYLAAHPQDYFMHLKLAGLLLSASTDYAQARHHAEQARRLIPAQAPLFHHYESNYIYGMLLLQLGQPWAARQALRQALALPLSPEFTAGAAQGLALVDATPWDRFYASAAPPLLEQCLERVACFLIPRGGALLDVGCGTGIAAQYLAPLLTDYLGVDWSPVALAQLAEQGLPGLLADLDQPLPLTPASWDVILVQQTLMFVADDRVFLTQLTHWLRPGGWLMLSVLTEAGPYPVAARTYTSESLRAVLATVAPEEQIWLLNVQDGPYLALLAFVKIDN